MSFCVYLFNNCPSQFLSHWKLAEPVFCREELSCLPYKNPKPDSQFFGEKIQIYTQEFPPPLRILLQKSEMDKLNSITILLNWTKKGSRMEGTLDFNSDNLEEIF